LWSCSGGPATISEAEADPPFTSTTMGTVFNRGRQVLHHVVLAAAQVVVAGGEELLARVSVRPSVDTTSTFAGRKRGNRDAP